MVVSCQQCRHLFRHQARSHLRAHLRHTNISRNRADLLIGILLALLIPPQSNQQRVDHPRPQARDAQRDYTASGQTPIPGGAGQSRYPPQQTRDPETKPQVDTYSTKDYLSFTNALFTLVFNGILATFTTLLFYVTGRQALLFARQNLIMSRQTRLMGRYRAKNPEKFKEYYHRSRAKRLVAKRQLGLAENAQDFSHASSEKA